MGSVIVKIGGYYLEYSSVSDGFASYPMTLVEFTDYYQYQYGRRAMDWEFPDRMKRVEQYNSSGHGDESAWDALTCNRLGDYHKGGWSKENRSELTWEEVQLLVVRMRATYDYRTSCQTCGRSRAWHKEHRPRHVFKSLDDVNKKSDDSKEDR
jgi:hypothetical protein